MLNFTTRGNVMKAEFLWTIQNTFHWPTDRKESDWDSPTFYAEKDEEIKWSLKIQSSHHEDGQIFLFLYLVGAPANEPAVDARICVTITDEEKGKLLLNKTSYVVPLTVDTRYGQPSIIIGSRRDLQVIPSVLIRVIVEYEKQGQVETTIVHTDGATSLVKGDPKNSLSADFEDII